MEHELNLVAIIAVAAALLTWSVLAPRLERWNISAPMFFVAVGLVMANAPGGPLTLHVGGAGIRSLAEVTLAIVLFGDAAAVRARALRRDVALPGRLLGIGLPLTMALGTITMRLLFPDLSWWVCAVVGAAVAPTDAALGAAIIEDERVPNRIRRVLNVESGLNDGIATPFVNFFLVAAVAGTTLEHGSLGGAVVDLLVGVVFGAVVGYVGGWALARWGAGASTASRNVGALSLSLIAYAGAVEIGANGFVAAFIAGLAYGTAERRRDEHPFAETLNLTHQGAELLSLTVWFLFGAVMMPQLTDATWRDVVFALLALTVLRIAPVWLSLVGVDFDRSTVGVIGWFGPRGLASIVFALDGRR